MKPYYFTVAAMLMGHVVFAGQATQTDTTKKAKHSAAYTSIEQVPEFPGGLAAFGNYISKNLKYPEIARLIGINGKVVLSFIIEKNGEVSTVTPMNCIGAGCEAEAVKVLEQSPKWLPGIQNSKPVRVQYTVPITFVIPQGRISFKDLQNSDYGFIFDIKGKLYTAAEAQAILGSNFPSTDIQIAEPYYNYDKNQQFTVAGKKEVYLIRMKDN
ncbi:energy transducer TonB [Mucilaginibacter sp. Mucisp86]|uniref:energy transducer TonB n=1 Tax=Mucilaginibacter sp. Mucisp86 TaxID=3243060 RepID=UPI0039B6363F